MCVEPVKFPPLVTLKTPWQIQTYHVFPPPPVCGLLVVELVDVDDAPELVAVTPLFEAQ
jgi:hypothetical protein